MISILSSSADTIAMMGGDTCLLSDNSRRLMLPKILLKYGCIEGLHII